MLGQERRQKILERVTALLVEVDPDVRLHDVILDSTRQQLSFVMQKGEWPVIVAMSWLDYVSHRDPELKTYLQEGLQARLEAARARAERAEKE